MPINQTWFSCWMGAVLTDLMDLLNVIVHHLGKSKHFQDSLISAEKLSTFLSMTKL